MRECDEKHDDDDDYDDEESLLRSIAENPRYRGLLRDDSRSEGSKSEKNRDHTELYSIPTIFLDS